MGLYILNISVDPTDTYPEYISEDLSINDQESIIEIVVEKIMGFENAITEYDDNDFENEKININFKITVFAPHLFVLTFIQPIKNAKQQNFLNFDSFILSGFCQLNTPPPKI
jgi:hypothetical protein